MHIGLVVVDNHKDVNRHVQNDLVLEKVDLIESLAFPVVENQKPAGQQGPNQEQEPEPIEHP